MADLESLPVELSALIFESLSVADAYNVAKTCRRLYIAAVPCLYHDIDVNGGELAIDCKKKSAGPAKLIALCRTLVERPNLARHVRTFETCNAPLSDSHRILQAELCLFRDAVDRLHLTAIGKHECEQFLECPPKSSSVLILLILSCCVRLVRLSTSSHDISSSWLKHLIASKSAFLGHVMSIRIIFYQYHLSPKELDIRHILDLPNIKVLQLSCRPSFPFDSHDADLERIGATMSAPSSPGCLTALSVLYWLVPIERLVPVLQQHHSLRTLEMDFMYFGDYDGCLNLAKIGTGLQHLHTTLRHLIIHYDIYDDEPCVKIYRPGIIIGDLAFLRQFTALESLETSISLLLGQPAAARELDPPELTILDITAVLPSNLRKLTINNGWWPEEWFYAVTPRIVLSVSNLFFSYQCDAAVHTHEGNQDCGEAPWKIVTPRLRKFAIETRRSCKHKFPMEYCDAQNSTDELRRVCASQDIECSISFNDEWTVA